MGVGDTDQEGLNSDTHPAEQEAQKSSHPAPSSPVTTGVSSNTSVTSGEKKIEILLKNVGSAPILKKSKWAVKASSPVSEISKFIIKYLGLDKSQSLFIYVNQSFAPALDQTIENLFDCFESDKKLVLYYATSQAWG